MLKYKKKTTTKNFINHKVFFWLQEGGVLGFYRGLTPTLIGMAPYAGDHWDFGVVFWKDSKSPFGSTLTVSPLSRILILHLWHAEESWPQTLPRARGSTVFRQSQCPHSKTLRERALRWRGRCRRPDSIVSAAARESSQLWDYWPTTSLIIVCKLAAVPQ